MELTDQEIFGRTERLLGTAGLERLRQTRVIIFGVGGVGSWCAESLIRSGVGRLTMVDPDTVQPSNINRQLMATTGTVGQPKAEVLRRRLLDISPRADIQALCTAYAPGCAADFRLGDYDYVVDAIDSLEAKAHLLCAATEAGARVFASMGAALKLDPQQVRVAEFWKVRGCPLAAALRRRYRKQHTGPAAKVRCVYSEELQPNRGASDEDPGPKACINGTVAHAVAVFGFTLAGLVVQDVLERA